MLNYFKTKYPKLKKVAIKDINSEMVQKYHGYAMFHKSDKFIYKGKTRQREVEPYSILLNKKLKDNLYVLLH